MSVRALQAVHATTHQAESDTEEQMNEAFRRYDAGEGDYISDDEMPPLK
jgi:Ca2+-binding EF-hand superfamily protein